MTPITNADFDICLYDPSGTQVGSCTTGSTGSTGSTDTITQPANVSGNWRLHTNIWSGTGTYTMSVSTSGGSGVPVTVRDDDNEKDTHLPMNYVDDTAVKRLNVTSAQLSGKTTATLHVYGQSVACGASGNRWQVRANADAADVVPHALVITTKLS